MKGTEEHKNKMAEKEEEVKAAKVELDAKIMTIGNLVHDSVPISNDEVRFIGYVISLLLDKEIGELMILWNYCRQIIW